MLLWAFICLPIFHAQCKLHGLQWLSNEQNG